MKPYRTRSLLVGAALGIVVAIALRSARPELTSDTTTASRTTSSR